MHVFTSWPSHRHTVMARGIIQIRFKRFYGTESKLALCFIPCFHCIIRETLNGYVISYDVWNEVRMSPLDLSPPSVTFTVELPLLPRISFLPWCSLECLPLLEQALVYTIFSLWLISTLYLKCLLLSISSIQSPTNSSRLRWTFS